MYQQTYPKLSFARDIATYLLQRMLALKLLRNYRVRHCRGSELGGVPCVVLLDLISLKGLITTKQLSRSIGTDLIKLLEENLEGKDSAARFEKVRAKEEFS